ncbi:hypothetical protein SNE40_007298 [Patella caerulea]|uniref:Uncharacterized protein n=1 Tax=Patella caerulea TaxID=87958 RepID=A0AAN8JY87_PATCE
MTAINKVRALLTPVLLALCVTLGTVTYLQHERLTKLENHLEDTPSGNRYKRSVDYDLKKWKEEMISHLKPFIEDLVKSSVKNRNKQPKDCVTDPAGPAGEKGAKGDQGLPGPSRGCGKSRTNSLRAVDTACCERLSVPVIAGFLKQEITATAGQEQLLPCVPSVGYPYPIVTWNASVDITPEVVRGKDGLYIPHAAAHHEGIYTCTITNIFGTSSKEINLKVRGNVTINLIVPTQVYTQGTHAMALLDCEFTGVPKPKIDWQHLRPDGQLVTLTEGITTADNSSILTVNNPTFLDSGLYTCNATNRYESQSSIGVLEVTAPPIILTPPKNQSVIKGIDLTLHCIVISDPLANITWVFPDVSGHKPFNAFNNDDGSVTIKDVEQLNEGSYTCTATNRLGSVSASATLTVLEPVTASIAFPLQSLTNARFVALDCRASGDPTPDIKWDKIGAILDVTEARYIFLQNGDFIISSITKDTEEKDSGFYSCTADNSLSNATAYAIVYFDHGDIDCNTTFDKWNSGIGAAHGVMCPQGCLAMNNGDVYGSNPYSVNSPICSAALHNGVIDNSKGGLVLWYVIDGRSSIFSSTSSNGVSSLSSGPLFEGAMIVELGSGLYKFETSKVPVIG